MTIASKDRAGRRVIAHGMGLVLISLVLHAGAAIAADQLTDPNVARTPTPSQDILRNWTSFRGPSGNGHAARANPPLNWSAEDGRNVLWKTTVPKHGMSSPVVWENRLFLTGADDATRQIYCFDTDTRHPGEVKVRQSITIIMSGVDLPSKGVPSRCFCSAGAAVFSVGVIGNAAPARFLSVLGVSTVRLQAIERRNGMLRYIVCLSVLTVCNAAVRASDVATNITIRNASFEAPTIDPNAFPAWPAIDDWLEPDLDAGSQNTGVFANTATGSEDHVANADGSSTGLPGISAGQCPGAGLGGDLQGWL